MIRVLVVDDHPIYRDGLRAALRADDVSVVGEATTADEAVAAVRELSPDLVLMDVGLPGSGLEATRQIVTMERAPRVLVLTMSEDARTVSAAVRAGATGFLVKGSDRAQLLDAIRAVASGTAVFGGPVGTSILRGLAASGLTAFPQLTERECEILELLADGLTNAAISQRLVISAKTVRNHVSNIVTKLGVDGRQAAAALVDRHQNPAPQ